MKDILTQMRETIRQHDLIQPGDAVVVGFSGGPDSLCLLTALSLLREELGIRALAAVHVNHLYRGEAAFQDEAFCEGFCREHGIVFRGIRADINALAAEWRLSSEEAGRQVRYGEFRKMAEELAAPVKIAVAHNREDQAETLFMRLARGTGTEGLCGIDYQREDGVIRPLLDCSRRDIEAFLVEQGLQPRIDHTNLEPLYTRNKVRLQVFPFVRETLGVDLTGPLAELSEIAREDQDFIGGFVEEVWKQAKVIREDSSGCALRMTGVPGDEGVPKDSLGDGLRMTDAPCRIVLPREALMSCHPTVRKRVILRCLKEAGLPQDVTSVHLNQAERLLRSHRTTGETGFPHGFVMKRRYDNIIFEKIHKEDTPEWVMTYTIVETPEEVRRLTEGERPDAKGRRQYFDLDKIRAEGGEEMLELRTRRAGDRFSPKGFAGTKKLQNHLVDRKIDRDLRDRLPLLCLGSRVLWIVGQEVGETCRVKEETERILAVEIGDGRSEMGDWRLKIGDRR